jgi:hypothetical protein
MTACLWARSLNYQQGGGHRWVYINWALGLRDCGFEVIWLESVTSHGAELQTRLATLKHHLKPYGLADSIALCAPADEPLNQDVIEHVVSLDAATQADILLDLAYSTRLDVVGRFRRSALIDIDPGLTQNWINDGLFNIAPHDYYFTIGENIGSSTNHVLTCGYNWIYVPPCVNLNWWPVREAPNDNAPYTTVCHWLGETDETTKKMGFLPYLNLPGKTSVPLELALYVGGENEVSERAMLKEQGWSVRHSHEVSTTPWDYQRYIQASRGEFSCTKPSYVRLQNAWVSDRTICYLSSGKPAIVEHTGPSQFLPDASGLLRFKNPEEATTRLSDVEANYDKHSLAARALAEEFFDSRKVIQKVLDFALS